MALSLEPPPPTRWWQNVWVRALLLHPLLSAPAAVATFVLAMAIDQESPYPLLAVGTATGTVATIIMLSRRSGEDSWLSRIVLVIGGSIASVAFVYVAGIVLLIGLFYFGCPDDGTGCVGE